MSEEGAAAEATGEVSQEATSAQDWREALPESLREAPALRDVRDPAHLAEQYVEQQSYLGNALRVPGPDASDEDRAAFRSKLLEAAPSLAELRTDDPDAVRAAMRTLGAPEDATGYKLPDLGNPELKPVPGFNEWAHEANLTQTQFDTIARRFSEQQVALAEQQATEHNAGMESLHRDWGYAYDDKLASAVQLASMDGAPEGLAEALKENRVPAAHVRWLVSLAERLGAEGAIAGPDDGRRGEITRSEARAQLEELMANKEHPYWTARPGTEAKAVATERVMYLRQRAMGAEGRKSHVVLYGADEEGSGGSLFAGRA